MKKEKVQYIGFAAIVAFAFLAICSRSSFIYIFNNWDDANSYFTMGKVMMNGGVFYRDSFDQKGPLLYFIYGLAYLISHNTFKGVFVMEIISLAVFLIAQYKILRLFLEHEVSMFFLPFVALVVTSCKSFYWGGSAEEFCLSFLAWGLYFSLRYFKEEHPKVISVKILFLCGVLAGCIMLIKYTVLGMYFFWMAMIAFSTLNREDWKKSIQNCFIFLAGMIAPVIPWLIYFGDNGALDDWYHAYIYCNVFFYSDFNQESVGIEKKIYDLAKILYWLIIDNFIYFSMIILGFAGVLFARKVKWFEKINIYGMFGFLFLGIFIGGTTLFYYSLPLPVFAVFGFVILGQCVEKIGDLLNRRLLKEQAEQEEWKEIESANEEQEESSGDGKVDKVDGKQGAIGSSTQKNKSVVVGVGTVAIYAVLLLAAWNLSMNTGYAKETAEDFYLYKFRDIILQEENPTLLNIGCLDTGLYTLTGIVPNCKYFQSNMVNGFTEVRKEQTRYIEEGLIQFVIAREEYPEVIWDKYELVCEDEYVISENPLKYYLFKKK